MDTMLRDIRLRLGNSPSPRWVCSSPQTRARLQSLQPEPLLQPARVLSLFLPPPPFDQSTTATNQPTAVRYRPPACGHHHPSSASQTPASAENCGTLPARAFPQKSPPPAAARAAAETKSAKSEKAMKNIANAPPAGRMCGPGIPLVWQFLAGFAHRVYGSAFGFGSPNARARARAQGPGCCARSVIRSPFICLCYCWGGGGGPARAESGRRGRSGRRRARAARARPGDGCASAPR